MKWTRNRNPSMPAGVPLDTPLVTSSGSGAAAPVLPAAAAPVNSSSASAILPVDSIPSRAPPVIANRSQHRKTQLHWLSSNLGISGTPTSAATAAATTTIRDTATHSPGGSPIKFSLKTWLRGRFSRSASKNAAGSGGSGVRNLVHQLHHCGNQINYGAGVATVQPSPLQHPQDSPLTTTTTTTTDISKAAPLSQHHEQQQLAAMDGEATEMMDAKARAGRGDSMDSTHLHTSSQPTIRDAQNPQSQRVRQLAHQLFHNYSQFYLHPEFKLSYQPVECLDFRQGKFTFRFKANFGQEEVVVKFLVKEFIPESLWTTDSEGHRVPFEALIYRNKQNFHLPEYIHDYEDEHLFYIITHCRGLPQKEAGKSAFFGTHYHFVDWQEHFQ